MSIKRKKTIRYENINEDELIKIVTSSSEPIEPEPITDVELFIHDLRIESGSDKVYTDDIYRKYCEWEPNPKKQKNRIAFFVNFSKFFEKGADGKSYRYYKLNATPFEDENGNYERKRYYDKKKK